MSKRYFVNNWNGVLTDLILELGEKNTTKFSEADVVILWNEMDDFSKSMIQLAKSQGKKVYVYQHGRKGSSKYFPPFNEKILCDKLFVWGEADKKALVDAGHPANKIEVVGTSIFNHIQPREKHEGINLLYCPEHWGVEVDENKVVAGWVKNLKGVKVTTKLLPEHKRGRYQNVVMSDRQSEDHFEVLAELLKTTDIVVGISESTLELCAEYLDIPVIIADIWQPKAGANGDERYKTYQRTYSNACTKVKNETEFQVAVQQYIDNPSFLSEQRKRVCELEGGSNLDFIKEIQRWI